MFFIPGVCYRMISIISIIRYQKFLDDIKFGIIGSVCVCKDFGHLGIFMLLLDSTLHIRSSVFIEQCSVREKIPGSSDVSLNREFALKHL